MTARQVRTMRGVAASAVTTLLAATAHTIGGGGAPAPLLVATAAMLAAPLGIALIGRRASLARTVAAVTGAQFVFHLVFALFGAPGAASAPAGHAHLGMHMGGQIGAPMTATTAPHGLMTASMAPDAGMILTHLAAVAITVLLLHRGERTVRAVLRGLARLLPLLSFAPPAPGCVLRRHAATVMVARTDHFGAVLSRRGPPLPLH